MSSTEAGGLVCARKLGPLKLITNASAEISATIGIREIAGLRISDFSRNGNSPTTDGNAGSRLERLPIDYDSSLETPDGPAVFGWRDVDHHLIAGFERSVRPAQCRLLHQILSFDHPMHCVAAVILCIDLHEHVRIRPDVLCHRTFYGYGLFGIVRRVAVMREKGQGSR